MRRQLVLAAMSLCSVGCMVGPNYRRPAAPAPPLFKEQPPVNFKELAAEGWKQSQPGDAYTKGRWWEVYGDPDLNALEEQVNISNQNVAQAEAQYRQAKAAVRVARSALFPTVGVGPSISSSRAGGINGVNSVGSNVGSTSTGGTRSSFSLPFDVVWEPDIWGSIRRDIAGASATAQSFAAVVENARLLYQAE